MIQNFTDLIVWQQAHKLVLFVYDLVKKFPTEERYGLSDQLRRSAVSVTSNIAEGFARRTNDEKIHFYFISRGSLAELQSQLLIARDLGYISSQDYNNAENLIINSSKLLVGFTRSVTNR